MPDKVSFRFKDEPEHGAAGKRLDELAAERGSSANDIARELLIEQLLKAKDSPADASAVAQIQEQIADIREAVAALADAGNRPTKGVKLVRKDIIAVREDLATMFTAFLIRFAKVDKQAASEWVKAHLAPRAKGSKARR